MSSITAQQTKLDLELVPKENRLDIKKSNGRILGGLKPEDTASFLRELGHTKEINSLNDIVVDQMHQPWRTFATLINRGLSGKTSGLDKLRLSRAQILWGMYYQKNVAYMELLWEDFIYHIDNKVYEKQEKIINSHLWKLLPETLTSPEMKESKAYKTYLGYASGTVPPKIARKFKKASPSKKDSSLVPADDEPAKKGKRVKRSSKKSTTTPATCIVISEAPVETQSKRKEKVVVTRGKGIETHPSGSGIIVETPPSVEKIKSLVTSKGTDSKSNRQEDEEEVKDDDEEEDEFAHTPPNTDDEEDTNMESKNDDKIEGDEDRRMDDTINQFNDDVDARLNEPTQTDEEVVQDKEVDVEMTDAQHEKENLKITQEQVIEDAHVTILTVAKEIEVPGASFSHSSDLASKFLKFLDIHPNDGEIVSPLDVHVHHEVPRTHTSTLLTVSVLVFPELSPVCTTIPQSSQIFTSPLLLTTPTPPPTIETTNTPSKIPDFALVFRFNERFIALEKDVAELKKDPLHTQVTALVDDHLDTRMGETREEFMNFLSTSLTERITEQVKNLLPQILPEEVFNFAPPMIENMIEEPLN
nr:hypothetical protein [Tanacetum cinerariifolium]